MRTNPKTGKILSFKKYFYLNSNKAPVFVKHYARPSLANSSDGFWTLWAWDGLNWKQVGTVDWKNLSKFIFLGRQE